MINLQNVTYTYSPKTPFEKTAIKGVSLDIGKGELIGIIGHTGSGKSTLIQLMNGLLKPTSGEVLFNGEKMDKVNTKIGMVFQYPENQIFEETIEAELKFGPKNIGMSKEETDTEIKKVVDIMGIDSDLSKSPHFLSGGQKRKIAIASVLTMKPQIIILDEPTAGLDPGSHRNLLQTIVEMNKQGITIILVSHSMEDIAEICNRIIVLSDGNIFADGTASEIFARSTELQKLGLDIPEITKYMEDKGYPHVWTVAQATEILQSS